MQTGGRVPAPENPDWRNNLVRPLTMCGLILALHALNFERIPEGGGLGWDGKIYADMIRNLTAGSAYYVGRIIPTLLLAPFGNSTAEIVRSFQVWNLLVLLAGVFVWERIGNSLSLSDEKRWLGFFGIFFTFLLKQTLYDPVLVDPTALLFALLLLMFHLEHRTTAVAVTAIVGAFCWPMSPVVGAALICCRGGKDILPRHLLLYGAGVIAILALALWFYPIPGHEGASQAIATALPSIALFGAFAAVLGIPRLGRLWLGAIVILLPWIIQREFADASFHPGRGTDLKSLFLYCVTPHQIGMVFLPFVSLAVYFGPLFILGVLRWRDLARRAKELSLGTVILVHLPLALVTEPRFWIMVWPFVVVPLITAIDFSRRQIIILSGLCIVLSRVWLPINVAPWPPGELTALDQIPKQMWFMNYGFWMTWWAFLLNSAVTLVIAAILHGMLAGVSRHQPVSRSLN